MRPLALDITFIWPKEAPIFTLGLESYARSLAGSLAHSSAFPGCIFLSFSSHSNRDVMKSDKLCQAYRPNACCCTFSNLCFLLLLVMPRTIIRDALHIKTRSCHKYGKDVLISIDSTRLL